MADIYSQQLIVEVLIDEGAVSSIVEGAKAEIEVDSFRGQFIPSQVLNVSWRGLLQGGLTVYPVTLPLEPISGLRLGMSCEVTIIVDESLNTLFVPHSALNLKLDNAVLLAGVVENEDTIYKLINGVAYETKVTLGLKTDNFVELLSGVEQGDVIIIGTRAKSQMPSLLPIGSVVNR